MCLYLTERGATSQFRRVIQTELRPMKPAAHVDQVDRPIPLHLHDPEDAADVEVRPYPWHQIRRSSPTLWRLRIVR